MGPSFCLNLQISLNLLFQVDHRESVACSHPQTWQLPTKIENPVVWRLESNSVNFGRQQCRTA